MSTADALAYIDKTLDNVADLDVVWENAEVVEVLEDVRSLLVTGEIRTQRPGGAAMTEKCNATWDTLGNHDECQLPADHPLGEFPDAHSGAEHEWLDNADGATPHIPAHAIEGHASPTTTRRYVQYDRDRMRAAVEELAG